MLISDYEIVVLDLTNIEALSPSFTDELFAILRGNLGDSFSIKIKIVCPKVTWRRLIHSVMAHRKSI